MQKTQYFFSPQPQQTNRKKRVQICTRKHNFEVQTNVYSFEYKSVLEINTEYDLVPVDGISGRWSVGRQTIC